MVKLHHKIKLGVNIDHIATLRQARKEVFPDPLAAGIACQRAGADSITVHLREDRRHIQKDVLLLKKHLRIKLNLEMAVSPEILKFALKLRPHDVCLVPEKRQEVTTEGGLDVVRNFSKISSAVEALKNAGVTVSIFINPDAVQIKRAKKAGADAVELHTGKYAAARTPTQHKRELKKLIDSSSYASKLGLKVNAGHGLDYKNVVPVARIKGMQELNIGFSIIARAVFTGIEKAVKDMHTLIKEGKIN